MTSEAYEKALKAVSNMERRMEGKTVIPMRPKGVPFHGYPELTLDLLFENGGIVACPQNDWLRRWLRRS